MHVFVWLIGIPPSAVSDEIVIVAEIDKRRRVRKASRPYADDAVSKMGAYWALIEQLGQLSENGEILSTSAQGSSHLLPCHSRCRLHSYTLLTFNQRKYAKWSLAKGNVGDTNNLIPIQIQIPIQLIRKRFWNSIWVTGPSTFKNHTGAFSKPAANSR